MRIGDIVVKDSLDSGTIPVCDNAELVTGKNVLVNGWMDHWKLGAAAAPDAWTFSTLGSPTIARESTIVKLGTYSTKIISGTSQATLQQNVANNDNRTIAFWKNRTATFGCWVYATVASTARIVINDAVGESFSSYHTGGSSWEYLTVTRPIVSTATQVLVYFSVAASTNTVYFGQAAVIEGDALPNTSGWDRLAVKINESVNAGQLFSSAVVSTYSLIYTLSQAYLGGVLDTNGNVHFVPFNAVRGQKISPAGVVSTYSLVYTISNAYNGGVLAANGDIHLIPHDARVGQKISASGVVSTYSLVYTTTSAYSGGVLAPNGDIHFIPSDANRGQKISSQGVVSTYSLAYTEAAAFGGGVLAPNGDIHFVPVGGSLRAEKLTLAGVSSTYSLVYTTYGMYFGGVISPSGDIHLVPANASRGQKISSAGVVSTYSLAYTISNGYYGGVLAPNGDIHFVPYSATVGQKVSASGVVSTYSLGYTTGGAYVGGVLMKNGDIHFVPYIGSVGQKISTDPSKPLSNSLSMSPFLNKL